MMHRVLTKTVGARVLTMLVGLAVGVLMLEAGVRLFMPQYSPATEIHFSFDSTRNIYSGPRSRTMRQVKNTGDYDVEVKFNSEGFRESRALQDAGLDDWILVGDSFTFGWGVEVNQRFGDRLEAAIGSNVYNLAAPGNLVHYGLLLDYAEKLGADTSRIIVGLCVENDVLDYELARQQGDRVVATPLLVKLKRVLGNSSATWRAATTLAHSSNWIRDSAIAVGAIAPGELPDSLVASERAVASTVRQLTQIAETRETVVLIIPSRQVFVDRTRAGARVVHQTLVQALTAAGVRVVDPLPDFDRSEDPHRDFHFRHDGHWNPLGHEVAAGALVDAMSDDSQPGFATPSIQ